MAAIRSVRIKSGLDAQEFERRLLERRPRFREVPGLVQKIYGRDNATGDVCGTNMGQLGRGSIGRDGCGDG